MSDHFQNRLEKIVEVFADGNKSEFARRLDMSPQTFNNYVQGNRNPGWDVIKRFLGVGVNLNYLVAGVPPIKTSDIKEASVETFTVEESNNDYFADFNQEDLSEAEAQILAEVKQFSAFLESRPLRPQVKRLLLELLIRSIDQAIAQPPPGDDDS